MKTYQLFVCGLTIITGCVFTWQAQTALGEVIGYLTVVISMTMFSKNMISRLNA